MKLSAFSFIWLLLAIQIETKSHKFRQTKAAPVLPNPQLPAMGVPSPPNQIQLQKE